MPARACVRVRPKPFLSSLFSRSAMARTHADRGNTSKVLRYRALKIMLDRLAATAAASAAASANRDLDFVELFAGDHAVSRGLRAYGYRGLTFDIRTIDPKHDILTPVGFLAALAAINRLRPKGLLFAAPVCSTWVFMSRGSTGRDLTLAGHWQTSRSVKAANAMVARVAALCHFAAKAGSHFVIEQPASSVMYSYKPFKALRAAWPVKQVRFPMAVYGGGSLKPSWLAGTAPWMCRLALRLGQAERAFLMPPPVSTAVTSEGPGGKKCSTGSSDLKGTQSYPLQFGAALAAEFRNYELGVASGDDPPASAGMTPGDMNADHMCDGDEELWSNPDWFLMDIFSGQPDMWQDLPAA